MRVMSTMYVQEAVRIGCAKAQSGFSRDEQLHLYAECTVRFVYVAFRARLVIVRESREKE
jgi:hypothetical protein